MTFRKDFFSSSVSLGSFLAVTLYLEFSFQLVYPALKVTGKIKVFFERLCVPLAKVIDVMSLNILLHDGSVAENGQRREEVCSELKLFSG